MRKLIGFGILAAALMFAAPACDKPAETKPATPEKSEKGGDKAEKPEASAADKKAKPAAAAPAAKPAAAPAAKPAAAAPAAKPAAAAPAAKPAAAPAKKEAGK